MRATSLALVVLLALFGSCLAQGGPAIGPFDRSFIDSFADHPPTGQFVEILPVQNPGNLVVTSNHIAISPGTILGGERDVVITVTNVATTNPRSGADLNVFQGVVTYSVDTGITGTGEIQWDGNDNGDSAFNKAGLSGRDLTLGGLQNAFRFFFIRADVAANITIEVWDMNGNSATQKYTNPGVASPTNIIIVWPFDTFPGVDFTNIGAARLIISNGEGGAQSSLDMDLGFIVSSATVDLKKRDFVTGNTITYEFTINSISGDIFSATSETFTFIDPIPAGARLVANSVNITGVTTSTILTGNAATDTEVRIQITVPLDADGNTAIVRFQVVYDFPLCNSTQLVNQARIERSGLNIVSSDWDGTLDSIRLDQPTVTPIPGSPALTLAFTNVTPTTAPTGSQVTYNFQVCNTGTREATGVTVAFPLPAQGTIVGSSWTCTNGTCSRVVAASLLQACVNDSFVLQIVANSCNPAPFTITARTFQTCPPVAADVTAVSPSVQPVADVRPTFDLAISPSVNVGGNCVSSTFLWGNLGNTNATNGATLTVVFEGQYLTPGANQSQWTCTANSCSYTITSGLESEGTGTVSLQLCTVATVACPVTNTPITATFVENCVPTTIIRNVTVALLADVALALTKTRVGTGAVNAGELVTFTLNVTNTGLRAATGVVLVDTTPQFATLTSAGWTCAGASCSRSIGNLAGGASMQETVTYRIATPLPCPVVSTTNVASVNETCQNRTATSNSVAVPLNATVAFTISKVANLTQVAPSGVINYTITFSNVGNRIADNVVITDTYGSVVNPLAEFNDAAGWSCDAVRCVFTVGSLSPADGTVSIPFLARVDATVELGVDEIDNNVTIVSPAPCAGFATTLLETELLTNPDVLITKTAVATAPIRAGDNVVFTLSYGNRGDVPAPNVIITETVPADLTFALSANAGWSCTGTTVATGVYGAGSVCTLNVGTVAAATPNAGSVTVTFGSPSILECRDYDILNTASITTTGPDTNDTNNAASANSTMFAEVELAITKTANASIYEAGTVIGYNITVTNNGDRVATNVNLVETIPEFTEIIPNAEWICDEDVGQCVWGTLSTLAPGEQFTVEFAVRVIGALPFGADSTENTVTVFEDCEQSQANASIIVEIFGVPDVKLCKKGRVSRLSYELTYSNCGSAGTTGVVLTETIPAGTTFNAELSDSRWECTATTCTLAVGDFDAAEAGCADFVLDINEGQDECATYENSAVITHALEDANPLDNSDEVSLGGCAGTSASVIVNTPPAVTVNCPPVTCTCPQCPAFPTEIQCSSVTCNAAQCEEIAARRLARQSMEPASIERS